MCGVARRVGVDVGRFSLTLMCSFSSTPGPLLFSVGTMSALGCYVVVCVLDFVVAAQLSYDHRNCRMRLCRSSR